MERYLHRTIRKSLTESPAVDPTRTDSWSTITRGSRPIKLTRMVASSRDYRRVWQTCHLSMSQQYQWTKQTRTMQHLTEAQSYLRESLSLSKCRKKWTVWRNKQESVHITRKSWTASLSSISDSFHWSRSWLDPQSSFKMCHLRRDAGSSSIQLTRRDLRGKWLWRRSFRKDRRRTSPRWVYRGSFKF